MKEKFSNEYRSLIAAIKTLSYKEVFIFMSVAIITFVSMYYASPPFFKRMFDTSDDKFYSMIYWFSADGFLMFIVPLILIPLFLKQKPSDFGFRIGDYKFGLGSAAIFIIVMIPVLWIATANESFVRTYPQGGLKVKESFSTLFLYELFVGFYMLGWEFFWRGYMLFGLKQRFGYYAIFIQMIPFFILHRGKPDIETFASIFAGLILGIQAWRANSFIYCFLVHWFVMMFVDVVTVLRFKSQTYGIGFDSMIKLFSN